MEEVCEISRKKDVGDDIGDVYAYKQPLFDLLLFMCVDMHRNNGSTPSATLVYCELMMNYTKYREVVDKLTTKYYDGQTFLSVSLVL